MLVPRLLPNNDREPLTRADCRASWPMAQIIGGSEVRKCVPCRNDESARARGVTTARGGVWTAVQVGSILRRVGHFASGRSIKQQTTRKADFLRQRPKGGRPPTHVIE